MRSFLFPLLGMFLILGTAVAQDDPKAIIEKAIKAHGGQEKLTKLKATVMKAKGTMSFGGMEAEFTMASSSQLPDRFRNEMKIERTGQTLAFTEVFDGKKGWVSSMGKLTEVTGKGLTEMKEQAFGEYAESLLPLLTDKQFKLVTADAKEIENHESIGVKVTAKGRKDRTMYFDKKTGMLLMVRKKATNPAGMEVDSESYLLDYKSVNGTKQPMKVLVKYGDEKFLEAAVTEIKLLESLDDKVFAKPE